MADQNSAEAGERWTPGAVDRALLGNKIAAWRPGLAVLLKLFQTEGRFPRRRRGLGASKRKTYVSPANH